MGNSNFLAAIRGHQPFLRLSLIVVFVAHSVPGMFDNGITNFGNLYLNGIGFYPFGIALAWVIKISHLLFVISLLTNRFLLLWSFITLIILLVGIFMLHASNGWFVVGGGTNGMEFSFLLIFVILTILNEEKLLHLNLQNR